MGLFTKSEFARRVGIAPASVTKAIKKGRLVVSFNAAGKERIDDTLHVNVQFLKDENHQRQLGKQNDPAPRPPAEPTYEENAFRDAVTTVQRAPVPTPSKKPGPGVVVEPDTETADLRGRYSKARTEKLEHQAKSEALKVARTRGELVEREEVYNRVMSYIDKLHSNLERLASAYLSDFGALIIDAGEVTPEHRAQWQDEVMGLIHLTKTQVVDELKVIAKEGV